jgi:hypothetical protein
MYNIYNKMDNFDLRKYLAEGRLFEGEEVIDFSAISKIDDLIDKELKKASKEIPKEEGLVNEAIFTTTAIILAIPSIVKGVASIIKSIKDKTPETFNLDKPDTLDKRLNAIISFAEKVDDILDTPIRLILKPFIKDQIKRNKVAKFLKALTLIIMSLGTDISTNTDIMKIGKDLSSEFFQELLSSKSIPDLITKVKTIIPKLLK